MNLPDVYNHQMLNEKGEWQSVAEIAARMLENGYSRGAVDMWLFGLEHYLRLHPTSTQNPPYVGRKFENRKANARAKF